MPYYHVFPSPRTLVVPIRLFLGRKSICFPCHFCEGPAFHRFLFARSDSNRLVSLALMPVALIRNDHVALLPPASIHSQHTPLCLKTRAIDKHLPCVIKHNKLSK